MLFLLNHFYNIMPKIIIIIPALSKDFIFRLKNVVSIKAVSSNPNALNRKQAMLIGILTTALLRTISKSIKI